MTRKGGIRQRKRRLHFIEGKRKREKEKARSISASTKTVWGCPYFLFTPSLPLSQTFNSNMYQNRIQVKQSAVGWSLRECIILLSAIHCTTTLHFLREQKELWNIIRKNVKGM
jgi:hypothetical protein